MAKYPKFLIAENPMAEYGQEYVLHTQKPRMLFKVIEDDKGNFTFEIVDQIDEENDPVKLSGLIRRLTDWWLAYLEWEENNQDSEKEPFIKIPALEDAHAMSLMHGSTFTIPSNERLSNLECGDLVKICASGERFWAKIHLVNQDNKILIAEVDNELVNTEEHGLIYGNLIQLGYHNIYAIHERD